MLAKSVSMSQGEGSVIISGQNQKARDTCLKQVLNSTHLFQEIEKLLTNPKSLETDREWGNQFEGSDPDIVSLSSDKEKIGVGEVRTFLSQLATRPINRKQKIGVISEAARLTPEAQNALLKTLEEPPTDCVIFLLLPNPKTLLPTVLSRCLVIDLGNTRETDKPQASPDLENLSLGQKFALAQKAGASKTEALAFLDNLLQNLHQKIVVDGKSHSGAPDKIGQAKKMISANANPRLTLENLFLDW